VSAGENVLAAALAAGIPLPHSCRAGRCATCKARLLSGEIAYPDDKLPPGLVASEAARGEVLLCQARPRSDLSIQARRTSVGAAEFTSATFIGVQARPLGVLHVEIKLTGDAMTVRAGQFVDLRVPLGMVERVVVIAVNGAALKLEFDTGGPVGEAVAAPMPSGTVIGISGPFENLR